MTPDEIQALREKHQPYKTVRDYEWCDAGCDEPYPCDVIKVLDALEAERLGLESGVDRFSTPNAEDEAQDNPCDHLIPDPITGKPTPANEWGHIFCPKCGIKLKEEN